jgi:hypothetical protein
MIEFLNNLPGRVIGVILSGEVTKEQYDRVYPRIEELAKSEGEINYLVKVATPLKNITAGTWWDDFKLALKHFSKWRKVAIVTDEKMIDQLADALGFAYPGESKTFSLSQFDEAVKWVAA